MTTAAVLFGVVLLLVVLVLTKRKSHAIKSLRIPRRWMTRDGHAQHISERKALYDAIYGLSDDERRS